MRWSALSRPQSALSRPLIVDHIVQLIEIVIPFGIILNGIYTNRYKTLGKWYLTTNLSIDLNVITYTITFVRAFLPVTHLRFHYIVVDTTI